MTRLNWGPSFGGRTFDCGGAGTKVKSSVPTPPLTVEQRAAHAAHEYWRREAKRRRRDGGDWAEADKLAQSHLDLFRDLRSYNANRT